MAASTWEPGDVVSDLLIPIATCNRYLHPIVRYGDRMSKWIQFTFRGTKRFAQCDLAHKEAFFFFEIRWKFTVPLHLFERILELCGPSCGAGLGFLLRGLCDLLVVLLQRFAEVRIALTLVIEINGVGWYKGLIIEKRGETNATYRELPSEVCRRRWRCFGKP